MRRLHLAAVVASVLAWLALGDRAIARADEPAAAASNGAATAAPPPAAPAPASSSTPPSVSAPPAPAPASPPAIAPAPPPPADGAATAPLAAIAPAEAPAAPLAAERPKLELAIGMGASIDGAGLTQAGTSAIPSFFAMGGFGDGVLGFDLGAFVNSANGRYRQPNMPVDRLAFDGMFVIRPAARAAIGAAGTPRYLTRVLRAAALDVGLGYERSSHIAGGGLAEEVTRSGLRVGAHADLPLTSAPPPGIAGGELRLRLAVRRMLAFSTPTFPDGTAVGDTRVELFAALAVVF